MKIKFVLLASVILTTLSSALSCDSLRVGMSIGSGNHKAKVKTVGTKDYRKLAQIVPSVGLFTGYDHQIKETPLFIGAELGLSNHNSEKTQYVSTSTLKLKTNNSLAAAIRFGVVANDTMLFVKTGITSTNWQTVVMNIDNNKVPSEKKTSFTKAGYLAGGGLETRLNENFSLGLEYEASFNREINKVHPDVSLKMKPLVQTTSTRLIYNF